MDTIEKNEQRPRKFGKRSRWILSLLALLFCVVLLEVSPYFIYPLHHHEPFKRSILQADLSASADVSTTTNAHVQRRETERPISMGHLVLHPYVGYVCSPDHGCNDFGFRGTEALVKSRPGQLTVCIIGGSVSQFLFMYHSEALREALQPHVSESIGEIKIVSLALGGYKQPQQLLSLAYMLSEGAEYDVVINIDGFNEMALTVDSNYARSIYASYPRNWEFMLADKFTLSEVSALVDIGVARRDRRSTAIAFDRFPFDRSNFFLFCWDLIDRKQYQQLVEASQKLEELMDASVDRGYELTGPGLRAESVPELCQIMGRHWARCSRILDRICRANDMAYFHFLQPNQYVPGSKALSWEERERFFDENSQYKQAVELGYPLMIEAGRELRKEGIEFHDFTELFKTEARTVYKDSCCHYNDLGNEILVQQIARIVGAYLARDAAGSGNETPAPQ